MIYELGIWSGLCHYNWFSSRIQILINVKIFIALLNDKKVSQTWAWDGRNITNRMCLNFEPYIVQWEITEKSINKKSQNFV